MKKFLLTGLVLAASLSMNAQETSETYNFFDPADCDENGWLWFDSAEKIAKYVGEGLKIQLIDAPFEIDDPDFPGEKIFPPSYADAAVKGYNTKGEEGGEGAKTGALVLAQAEGRGFFDSYGGGFLVHMPDCASFDVVLSSSEGSIYTELYGERSYVDAKDCRYIWNESDPSEWFPEDGPLTTEHYIEYLNVQSHAYDLTFGEGDVRDYLTFQGNKGENRTAVFYNRVTAPLYVHGIRIKTYTDVSNAAGDVAGVTDIAADKVAINITGKVISVDTPSEISVYNVAGAKVASAYGTSMDCSGLAKGVYVVSAGKHTLKAAF